MSKIEVNAIEPQCGTTLTVGASGDTITFPTGTTIVNNGSQTGFGRTGTVNWNTTPITSTPTTGANGIGYFIDASGGVRTINLPASPSAGDIMAISDYAQSANTNNITIGRNGSNIQGDASDLVITRNGVAITLVYVDATKGWVVTDTGAELDKEAGREFITATGGTITTVCTDYKVHTFTGPGTFTVCSVGNALGSTTVDYLVVAGGGGGGYGRGGAGGAGGARVSSGTASGCYTASPLGACVSALPVAVQGYPITVGSSGSGNSGPAPRYGAAGSNSVFSTITSTGGGGGSGENSAVNPVMNGGSGGGGARDSATGTPGGTGNTPPVSPAQGNNGGSSVDVDGAGGGGGGALAAGSDSVLSTPTSGFGGDGGTGITNAITGSSVGYAGGGGGGNADGSPSSNLPNAPSVGGGGTGGTGICSPANAAATTGATNTGGGGGGGGHNSTPTALYYIGANGGSGIVIIRYKFQ